MGFLLFPLLVLVVPRWSNLNDPRRFFCGYQTQKMQTNSVSSYLVTISERYKRGTATEHSYRGDLQQLIEAIAKDVTATNEPKRIACGAPDYIITKKDDFLEPFYQAKTDIAKTLAELHSLYIIHQFNRAGIDSL